jgi:hypothetical protein
MNINENKEIEQAEPSIKEFIREGKNVMLPELYDDYVYYEEGIQKDPMSPYNEPEYVHLYIIGLLTDKVHREHNCTRMQALRVVCFSLKDLLEKRKGIQTESEYEDELNKGYSQDRI